MNEGGEEIVDGNKLSTDEIIELCKTTKVTHFKLSAYSIYNKGFVDIQTIAPFLLTSYLKYLELGNHNSVFNLFTNELKKCTSLTYLDLSNPMRLHSQSVLEIIEALLDSHAPLVTLNLEEVISYYRDENERTATALATFISKCTSLRSLHIDLDTMVPYSKIIFQALKKNTTLKELHTTVDDEQKGFVEDCFDENTTIISGRGRSIARYITINQVCQQLNSTNSERRSIPKQLHSRDDIEAFLRELMRNGEQWNAGKLIFLGNGEVGKTALLNSIRHIKNKSKWFFQRAADWVFTSRTIGIDQSILILKDGEISVWDFGGQIEYTVTHQFFLSNEMVVIVICYDLSKPADVQRQQIAYWLDYLNSALPKSSSSSRSKWRVIIVGTKVDLCETPPVLQSDLVSYWQATWPDLPIHKDHFLISSRTLKGVGQVLQALETTFSSIFQHHSIRIPKSYKSLLHSLQSIPEDESIVPESELFQRYPSELDQPGFTLGLKFLHAIGRVLVLKGELVCTSPKKIPLTAAKFVAPEDARTKLIGADRVEILEEEQVGTLLTLRDNAKKLNEEVKLLEHVGVCFRLGKSLLFPSLASITPKISFTIEPAPHLQLGGIRFNAPRGSIFVPGFFCQLIVALFAKLNASTCKYFFQPTPS